VVGGGLGDDSDDAGGAVRGGSSKNRDGAVTPDVATVGSPDVAPPSTDAAVDQVTQSPPDAQADLSSPTDAAASPDSARQCLPGDKRCNGDVVQSCDTTATWQDIVSCPFLCLDGACMGRCAPGAHQCTGVVRQLCDDTGQWQDDLTCPFACVGMACAGACVPGQTQCAAGVNQVCSPAGMWQGTGGAVRELVVNGSFDLGETGWTNPGVPIVYPANGNNAGGNPDVAAQTPPDVAWLGGLNNEDDILSQAIAIPADASILTFSFYYAIITAETSAAEVDVFDAQLVTATQTIALAHLSDNNASTPWVHVSALVPGSLAGQTVTLRLHGVTNGTRITSFYIDTVSLQAGACP
jgi:hypothetical protein